MEKDVFRIILSYTKYWYFFLLGIVICLVLAFLHLRYNVTPEYYISSKIKVEGSQVLQSVGNLGLINDSKNIKDEVVILESFDLMDQAINELGYGVGYFVKGRFSEIEVYEKSIPFKIVIDKRMPLKSFGTLGNIVLIDEFSYSIEVTNDDASTKKDIYNYGEKVKTRFGDFHTELVSDKPDFKSKQAFKVRFRNVRQLAASYCNKLSIANHHGSLIELSLTDAIPERGVDVLNKLIEVYARNSAENKNFLVKSTMKIIDERLEIMNEDLVTVEKGAEAYKKNNDLTNVESDASRFINKADQLDSELNDLRLQINNLNSLENFLKGSSNDTFTPVSLYNIQSPVLNNSISIYNKDVQYRNNLINSSGTGNPLLPEIERRLLDSKNSITQNTISVKNQLVRKRKALFSQLTQYKSKISSVPTAERALLEIYRDQGIKQKLYLFLLQKREEEVLSLSVPFSDMQIIEEPVATSYIVNGARTPTYIGAILFGILIPVFFIFTRNTLNTNVLSKEAIQSITDIPILGHITNSKSNNNIVVSAANTTQVAELFRLLRHNLKFFLQGESNHVIMITSGKQGEGKTFISINLATSLALTGKKVVVLGFDLRVPKLMKAMGLPNKIGISDFIVDSKINVEDIITPYGKEENLSFIGSGEIPPNPGDLVLNDRIKLLIDTLKQTYDYIVIDTPPIGQVADANSLARFVDSTLFIVRYNHTKKEELNTINEVSKDKSIKNLMVVFNDLKMNKSKGYGYSILKKNKKNLV